MGCAVVLLSPNYDAVYCKLERSERRKAELQQNLSPGMGLRIYIPDFSIPILHIDLSGRNSRMT